MLEVLEANVARALMASSISASALFRAVEAWKPTLLIDEADTFARENDELTGIINAGHRKRTAVIIRSAKNNDDYLPTKFSVWSPMVIAAIGRLKETVMDRSIVIPLRRKTAGETVEKVPSDLFERSQIRRRKCLRWAEDTANRLKATEPKMPRHGNDRALDNWQPLFAMSEIIGGDWPSRVRMAFVKLSSEEEEEAIGPMLLNDIRELMTNKTWTRVFSATLVDALTAMEDRPWGEWKHGKPMSPNTLAKLLKPYKIRPASVRIGSATGKGYRANQFEDAWNRYLSPLPSSAPKQTVTPSHPRNGAGSSQIQNVTSTKNVTFPNRRQPSNGAGCDGVTVQNGGLGCNIASEDQSKDESEVVDLVTEVI
jgi:hypothetical protein